MKETRETQVQIMYAGNKRDSRCTDYVCRKQERLKEYQIMYEGNKRDSRCMRLCMQETRETQGV